jgi:hypothetical protein
VLTLFTYHFATFYDGLLIVGNYCKLVVEHMPREMAEKMVANKAKQKDQDDVLLDLEHNDLGCVNKKEKIPKVGKTLRVPQTRNTWFLILAVDRVRRLLQVLALVNALLSGGSRLVLVCHRLMWAKIVEL